MPFKVKPPCYDVWRSMKDRCYNPNHKQYKDYGGRGITVCERWLHDFHTFVSDMGPRPEGYLIDRIDNDGDYTPDNCRWTDRKTQQRNQRYGVFVTIEGRRYRAIELADLCGQKTDAIVDRARRGFSYEDVIRPDKIYNKDTSLAVAGRKAKAAARTHCRNGHPFTQEGTHVRKDGVRQCRICHNAKMRRLNAKKRDKQLSR